MDLRALQADGFGYYHCYERLSKIDDLGRNPEHESGQVSQNLIHSVGMSTFLRRQSDQERVWGYRDEMGNSCASETGAVLDDMGDSLGVGAVLWAVCWFREWKQAV